MRLVSSAWTLAVLTGCGAALLLSACGPIRSVTVGQEGHHHHGEIHGRPSDRHGPPPHAPAHGHRRKHQDAYHHHGGDAEFVFDSNLGVYVVLDLPHHYYFDGVYLRIEDGNWYASAQLDGEWRPRAGSSLPPGLLKKHGKEMKPKHKGKGWGPAKHKGK